MNASRETKFGYGFMLAGIGLPFLIEKLFGPVVALIIAAICTVAGVGCLAAGHFHRERTIGFARDENPKLLHIVLTSVLVIALAGSLTVAIVKFRTSQSEPSGPKSTTQKSGSSDKATNHPLIAMTDEQFRALMGSIEKQKTHPSTDADNQDKLNSDLRFIFYGASAQVPDFAASGRCGG